MINYNENQGSENILDESVLYGSMMEEMAGDIDFEGWTCHEFASFIGETVSGFAVANDSMTEAEALDFQRKYVAFTVPWLKLGGFEKLSKNISLDGLVTKHPWIGAVICGGGAIAGLWILWPKREEDHDQLEENYHEEE